MDGTELVALLAVLATLATALVAHTHRVKEWRYQRRYEACAGLVTAVHRTSEAVSALGVAPEAATSPDHPSHSYLSELDTRTPEMVTEVMRAWHMICLVCGDRTMQDASRLMNLVMEESNLAKQRWRTLQQGKGLDDEVERNLADVRGRVPLATAQFMNSARHDMHTKEWSRTRLAFHSPSQGHKRTRDGTG
jgi:hypothetical protein